MKTKILVGAEWMPCGRKLTKSRLSWWLCVLTDPPERAPCRTGFMCICVYMHTCTSASHLAPLSLSFATEVKVTQANMYFQCHINYTETKTKLLIPTSSWNTNNANTNITMEDYLGSNFSFVLPPTHVAVSCFCNLYVNRNREEIS